MDEADQLLSSAIAELDNLVLQGRHISNHKSDAENNNHNFTSSSSCGTSSRMLCSSSVAENGNRLSDGSCKENWTAWNERNRPNSGASSGVDSPPSDIPTSSSSDVAHNIYDDFIKAIEKHQIAERPDLPTQLKLLRWMRGPELESPSPSMSTVSCPEYPELQEKLHRLAMARDSLSLQVSVLTEQVSAQKEKIRDLETLLTHKRNKLDSTEELLQEKYQHRQDDHGDLESKKLDLMAEMSTLKLKYATLEREKNETERKLRMSQNEMEHLTHSMHGVQAGLQQVAGGAGPALAGPAPLSHLPMVREQRNEEMDELRHVVQRLIADNEAKNMQITSLRNALDEQRMRINERLSGSEDNFPSSARWSRESQPPYDFNAQLRKLLMDDGGELAHSTSYPISLCSSVQHPTPRSAVQSSSSFASSLSTASPQHSWSQGGTPRHLLHPATHMQSAPNSYRSPSSPAARQLAAELDELRRMGDAHAFASTSLPRGMGAKASSTLTLPGKKLSLSSGVSAGELRPQSTELRPPRPPSSHGLRPRMGQWLERLKPPTSLAEKKKRSQSTPNLVESDDEVTRGRNSTTSSTSQQTGKGAFRRDRTRSSLRNLFSKLTRSTSQDQHSFRRGSAARSTSSARLGSAGPLSGSTPLRPPLQQFVDWRGEQLAEWVGEIGYPQYAPEVASCVRSGRHLLNLTNTELENEINIKNPLHRKRIQILLRRIEQDVMEPVDKWDVYQVLRWLEEIGLPQYKEALSENLVDGVTLMQLTAADLHELRITSATHTATLSRSIQLLKMLDFKPNQLEKKFDPSLVARYPCPNHVVRWSHAATCEWLRTIDLAEFAPNLLCAGVPGAVMVYEPSFTAETLAEILQIPPHKTLLRRHLTSHFNQLLGQKIISEKRDYLAGSGMPQLTPAVRTKLVKKGFSLTRKKGKNEVILEPEEPLCPSTLEHKYPMSAESLMESLDSSNV